MTVNSRLTARATAACFLSVLLLLLTPLRATARTTAQKTDAKAAAGDAAFESGRLLLARGDAEGASAAFKTAAEKRKKDADAWYHLGLALSHTAKAKEARKAFEKAVKLRPSDPEALAGLAYTLLRLNKPRDAEREARRALNLDPQAAEARYVIGVVYFREEKFARASEEAETALRLKPTLAAAAYLAGEAVLNLYGEESDRQAKEHPLAADASETKRKAVLAKREPLLSPLRSRMRELADGLEAFAKSRPASPEADAWGEQATTLRLYSRQAGEGEVPDFLRADEVTRKAVITYKTEPNFTERARKNNVTGVVRLRAVLAADGTVRHIVAIKRLPDGLTERAIAAARQIRFTPAQKDGRSVSQWVVIEYNFNIY